MLGFKKDSTISSKLSEYDNVPVLPGDYHNHDDDHPSSPTHVAGYLLDDPPPVPPHQAHHAIPTNYHQDSPSPQKPLQFPTEENPTGKKQLHGDRQQQQQQQHYTSLDRQFIVQHKKGASASGFITCHQTPGRAHRDSYGGEMSTSSSMIFYCLVFLAEILMFGLLSLVLFWVVYYRGGFAWREDVTKEFNYHPVLMICGFIFFMGHAMLVNRLFRCCNKLTAKVLHTFLHLMAVPCIVVGTITVFDSHNLRTPPIPNLYSLHSWLGVVTIGLFALQLVVGFFSFWLLLCCEQGTARFRSGLVPVHATFGIITFMLAIATAVSGYTEKAFFSLSGDYSKLVDEAWVINAQAACLAGLAILMGFLLYSSRYARSSHPVAIIDPPSNSHYVMTQKTYYYREHE